MQIVIHQWLDNNKATQCSNIKYNKYMGGVDLNDDMILRHCNSTIMDKRCWKKQQSCIIQRGYERSLEFNESQVTNCKVTIWCKILYFIHQKSISRNSSKQTIYIYALIILDSQEKYAPYANVQSLHVLKPCLQCKMIKLTVRIALHKRMQTMKQSTPSLFSKTESMQICVKNRGI